MTDYKLPVVKEYKDALLIDGEELPYVIANPDGTTTTKAKSTGAGVEITVTFLAQSYTLDPHKRIHRSTYQFKLPWYKRLKQLFKRVF